MRGGALMAWYVPEGAGPATPYRVVGTHTDSPNLRVKPVPDTGSAGWRQIAVEIYGGVPLNTWLDRDLGLSGRPRSATAPPAWSTSTSRCCASRSSPSTSTAASTTASSSTGSAT